MHAHSVTYSLGVRNEDIEQCGSIKLSGANQWIYTIQSAPICIQTHSRTILRLALSVPKWIMFGFHFVGGDLSDNNARETTRVTQMQSWQIK